MTELQKKVKRQPTKQQTSPPFATLLSELEAVVKQLEQGDIPLEKSLQMYEQGAKLAQQAQQRLHSMQAKLEELTAEGNIEPLDNSE